MIGKGSIMNEDKVEMLADLIRDSQNIVVFTGAGVSTESGVPDFRSPGGIWDRFDPNEMTFQKFVSSRQSRRKYWELFHVCWKEFQGIEPNQAHRAIAELEKRGKLSAVITQNVEELHQKAGNSAKKVLELHGTIWQVRCLDCQAPYPWEEIFNLLEEGEEINNCSQCGGFLKPATIAFGQQLPVHTLEEAQKRSCSCDLFISIGSSLVVYPAAFLPQMAKESGASLAIVNREPTPFDAIADLVIHARAGESMKTAVELAR